MIEVRNSSYGLFGAIALGQHGVYSSLCSPNLISQNFAYTGNVRLCENSNLDKRT